VIDCTPESTEFLRVEAFQYTFRQSRSSQEDIARKTLSTNLQLPINNPHINTLLHKPPAVRRPLLLIGGNKVESLHKRRHKFRHFEQRDVFADAGSRPGSELF
jgi:hypothetical protein